MDTVLQCVREDFNILFLFLICTLAVQVANLLQPIPAEFVTIPDGAAQFYCFLANCVTWMIDDWVVINSTMGVTFHNAINHGSALYFSNSSAFNASKIRCLQPGVMSPPSVLFIQGSYGNNNDRKLYRYQLSALSE